MCVCFDGKTDEPRLSASVTYNIGVMTCHTRIVKLRFGRNAVIIHESKVQAGHVQ